MARISETDAGDFSMRCRGGSDMVVKVSTPVVAASQFDLMISGERVTSRSAARNGIPLVRTPSVLEAETTRKEAADHVLATNSSSELLGGRRPSVLPAK